MLDSAARNRLLPLVAYFSSAFVLHLAWENAQMPLFESGDAPFQDTFWMCFKATATGDMLFMLTLFATIATIHEDIWWLSNRESYLHPATWAVQIVIGVLLAVSFELWAVHVVNRWVYDSMPLVPVLGVGISPMLQMTLIPVASTAISRVVAKRE